MWRGRGPKLSSEDCKQWLGVAATAAAAGGESSPVASAEGRARPPGHQATAPTPPNPPPRVITLVLTVHTLSHSESLCHYTPPAPPRSSGSLTGWLGCRPWGRLAERTGEPPGGQGACAAWRMRRVVRGRGHQSVAWGDSALCWPAKLLWITFDSHSDPEHRYFDPNLTLFCVCHPPPLHKACISWCFLAAVYSCVCLNGRNRLV